MQGLFPDVPIELLAGKKPGGEYTEDQKAFALTVHLYSPKAYAYLRDEVKLPLPHPRSLCRYLF